MQTIASKVAARTRGISSRPSRFMGLTSGLAGLLFSARLFQPVQALSAPLPDPYSLTLAWDASPSPEIVGYVVYYGAASGYYTDSIAVGNVTTATVPGLLNGVTYYFAITAVDLFGQESGFSNEISHSQGLSSLQIHTVTGGQFRLTVTGLTGRSYDIEATQDFAAWTVIGTVTVGIGGSLDFTDTNAANFPQRFYRTRDTQP